MASQIGLSATIGANVTSLLNAFNQANQATSQVAGNLAGLGNIANQTAGNLNNLAPASGAAAAGITNLNNAVASGQASFVGMSNAATNTTRRLAPVGSTLSAVAANANRLTPALNNAAAATANLTAQQNRSTATGRNNNAVFIGLNNIVRDAPYGLIGMGNNITQLSDALFGASLAASAATFGISLLVTAGTVLVQKYGSLANAFDVLFDRMTAQEKAVKSLNAARDAGLANADAELVSLQSLYTATQNVNIPLAQRNKIIDELQKKYPAYFGSLGNEAILAGKAAGAYDRLKASIIAVAQSKAIEEELVANSKASRALKKDYDNLVRSQQKVALESFRLQGEITDLFAVIEEKPNSLAAGKAVARVAQLQKQLIENEAVVASYNKKLDEARQKQDDLSLATNTLADEQKNLATKFSAVTTGYGDAPKKIATISDVLKELTKEFAAIVQYSDLVGLSVDQLATRKIKALNDAFEKIAKIGGPGARAELKKLSDQINILSTGIIGEKKIKTTQLFLFSKQKINDKDIINKGKQNVVALDIPVIVRFAELKEGILAAQNQLVQGIKEIKSVAIPEIIDLSNALNDALKSLQDNLISGIGEAIGGIISGSLTFGSALNGLVGIMADFMVSFGKTMVGSAAAIFAAKKLITSPLGALAAGVVAIGVGTAIKASLNKFPSFSGGGKVNGATLAMVGDNPSGVEYMIPKEVLDKMNGGGGSGYIAETRISRGELLILIKQAMREEGRVGA